MLKAALVLSITLISVLAAHCETWICTYANEKNEPVITKLAISEGKLAWDRNDSQILQNNETGLVAAFGVSDLDPATKQPVVGGVLVVIEKQSGKLKLLGGMNYMDFRTRNGHCIQN
jgi:hypothetical protein